MARRMARERLEIARRLSPIAVGLFVFCGITLQVAILWSGYWGDAPARTAIPVRTITPVAVPDRLPPQPAARGSGEGNARSLRTGASDDATPSTGPGEVPDRKAADGKDEATPQPAQRRLDGTEPGRQPAVGGRWLGRA